MITLVVTLLVAGTVYIMTGQLAFLAIIPAIMFAKWYEGWKIRTKAELKTVQVFMEAGNYDNLPIKYKKLAQPWKDDSDES